MDDMDRLRKENKGLNSKITEQLLDYGELLKTCSELRNENSRLRKLFTERDDKAGFYKKQLLSIRNILDD